MEQKAAEPAAAEKEAVVEAPAEAEAPAAAETPAEAEQALRIVHPVFDMDWSPMRGGGNNVRLLSLWWASPMYFDKDGQLQPYVFNKWEPNADFTVWTVESINGVPPKV